jgi:hypothetical protein
MSKKSRKVKLTTKELKEFLKNKRILLDCKHHFTLHPFSNTLVMTADGKTYCHNCYQ